MIDFENLDILIGWSSFSLKSFITAQKKKCIKILERGSTHIEFQNDIVNEEYLLHNLNPRPISNYVIQKEKKEYEIADYITVPTEFARKTFLSKGFSKEMCKLMQSGKLIELLERNKIKRYSTYSLLIEEDYSTILFLLVAIVSTINVAPTEANPFRFDDPFISDPHNFAGPPSIFSSGNIEHRWPPARSNRRLRSSQVNLIDLVKDGSVGGASSYNGI